MIVLADSSPLITLARTQYFNLLHEFYGEVIVSREVADAYRPPACRMDLARGWANERYCVLNLWRARAKQSAKSASPDWNTDPSLDIWWHSFTFPNGESVVGVRSEAELLRHISQFPIPGNLSGKRVLDIGTWDGWFSFECERRGAEVVAVDCWDNPRFRYAHRQFGSRVEYLIQDVYELDPRQLGHFDVVLFFGVLYHLKHPILALERVCALSRNAVYVESHVLERDLREASKKARPAMDIYEANEFAGQYDNWVCPNTECLLSMCRIAGFACISLVAVASHRAYVTCNRHWERNSHPTTPRPVLLKVASNRDRGINFLSGRDEYVSCWVQSTERDLRREEVFPVVGEWGSIPLSVDQKTETIWQVNFKLPPGLGAGFHDVRVMTIHSTVSDPVRIAVDVPLRANQLKITGACDGRTWAPGVVALTEKALISIWVVGLPENADVANTEVFLANRRLAVDDLVANSDNSVQINASVPRSSPLGDQPLEIRIAGVASEPVPITVAGVSTNL